MIKINRKNISTNVSGAKIALLFVFEITVFGVCVTNESTIPIVIAPSVISFLFVIFEVVSSGIVKKSEASDT